MADSETQSGQDLTRNYSTAVIQSETRLPSPILSKGIARDRLIVAQYKFSANEVDFPPLPMHLITLNLGQLCTLFRKKNGQTERTSMRKGGMTLTTAELPRQWRWPREVEVLTIALSSDLFSQVIEREEININSLELIDQFGTFDQKIQYLCLSILAEIKCPGIADDIYLESLTNLLIIHLIRNYSAVTSNGSQVLGRLPNSRMQEVIDYIRDRLSEKITVADLADVVNLSSYHFSRVFQQEIGLTPHQYIIRYRVEEAKRLLSAKKLEIAEVAQQVGFADQSHLTRHFKQVVGVTPKQFIAKM